MTRPRFRFFSPLLVLAFACATAGQQKRSLPDSLGPEGWMTYTEASYFDGYSDGCFRSLKGDGYIRWLAQQPAQYRPLEQLASDFMWRREEAYPGSPGRLVYGLARSESSNVIIVNTRWNTLVSAIRSEADTESVLGIARAREFGVSCAGCSRLVDLPRLVPTVVGGGCSLPLTSAPVEGTFTLLERQTSADWAKVFPTSSQTQQVYQVNNSWDLQPVCSGGVLAGVTVDSRPASSTKGNENAVARDRGRGAFESALIGIDRVLPLGLPSPLSFNYGDFAGVHMEWPVHAVLGRALLTGSAQGGAELSISRFSVWYFRPVSGKVDQVRKPVGSDRRAAIKIDGLWYWTSERIGSELSAGQRATNVFVAGPDGGTATPKVSGCNPR